MPQNLAASVIDKHASPVPNNTPPGSMELWERYLIRAGRETAVGRALLERRPVHIPDVQAV
jgi:hypothetical protein